MKNPFTTIILASRATLSQSPAYWFWFLAFLVSVLVLFVLVPVWSVPGNDVIFQISLFTLGNWVLFAILAPYIALLLTMQVFIFLRAQNTTMKAKSLGNTAGGATGACAGLLGGVFATAACSWCVAAIFGFLGTGAIFFIARNQFWAVLVAVSIMLISLYFTSKKVVEDCGC